MKVTYNWLKDFVEIKISPETLAEKLTMAGIEVKSIEERGRDFIFEIEITSNRPDWLSVVGIAREVAAVTGAKLKLPIAKLALIKSKLEDSALKIVVENKKDCPLYTGTIIREVKVSPSPEWLRKSLELIGCRSVNNVVDITNYILFTWGEPLHAFDLDKLAAAEIIIRRAKEGERITTIDGSEKKLTPEILVIADAQKSQAVAGVMGSRDSEVSFTTKNILLEAALFDAVLIRRGRQKIGLQSESSYRFERGIDAQTLLDAKTWAIQMILEICGGRVISAKASSAVKIKPAQINLEVSRANSVLGTKLSAQKIKSILQAIGFKLKAKGKAGFRVTVPAFRQDVSTEIDLIEEIARIYGYERIPTTLPKVTPQVSSQSTRDYLGLMKEILVGMGLQEIITYSLIDRKTVSVVDVNRAPVEIANPLSQEQEVLRSTLIPSLLKCLAINLHQQQEYLRLFEIAKIFSLGEGCVAKEEWALAIALCGMKPCLSSRGRIEQEAGLLELKGIIEVLLQRFGMKDPIFKTITPAQVEIYIGKIKVGLMQELSKTVLGYLEIKNKSVFAVEIYLEALLAQGKLEKQFTRLSVYPGIARDISMILKAEIPAEQILQAIKEKSGALLEEVKVTDFYQGKPIPPGAKGLTVSCFYRSNARTLTEAEVGPLHSLVTQYLAEKFGAQFR